MGRMARNLRRDRLMLDTERPVCIGCNRTPDEIAIYVEMAEEEGITADEYVRRNEGTYNRANGHFACDPCYIRMGQPSSPTGWKAP